MTFHAVTNEDVQNNTNQIKSSKKKKKVKQRSPFIVPSNPDQPPNFPDPNESFLLNRSKDNLIQNTNRESGEEGKSN